jgi:hypothetical protein
MPIPVESYMVDGVLNGEVARSGPLRELLDSTESVVIAAAVLTPLDGSPAHVAGSDRFAVDDLLIVVSDELPPPAHSVRHRVRLAAGPYVLEGDLPTVPGFDPARAILRPTGSFVMLENVRIRLAEGADDGVAEHERVLVNRYAVESISADLMLGFFFPGAHLTVDGDVGAPAAAG